MFKKTRISILLFFIIAQTFFVYLSGNIQIVSAAVNLLYFRGTNVNNTSVKLEWETASETGTIGFLLNRKDTISGSYEQIGDFMQAQGDFTGNSYAYTDLNVVQGATYWYKLQEVDSGQNLTDIGFLSIFIGSTPTSTQTPTIAINSTKTQTPTITTPTRTPTRTNSPKGSGSSSAYKSPTSTTIASKSYPTSTHIFSTPTPSATAASITSSTNSYITQGSSNNEVLPPYSEGGTSTLEPLPSLEIVFQALSPTNIKGITTSTAIDSSSKKETSWISSTGIKIIGIIVVLWLVLGGWFIYSFRRME